MRLLGINNTYRQDAVKCFVEKCIQDLTYDENDSFEVVDSDKFKGYVSSLKEIKDEKVVKTDVNNVMLILKSRETNPDSYMISADGKLINWCKDIFIGKSSIVEFPSIWLSITRKVDKCLQKGKWIEDYYVSASKDSVILILNN